MRSKTKDPMAPSERMINYQFYFSTQSTISNSVKTYNGKDGIMGRIMIFKFHSAIFSHLWCFFFLPSKIYSIKV